MYRERCARQLRLYGAHDLVSLGCSCDQVWDAEGTVPMQLTRATTRAAVYGAFALHGDGRVRGVVGSRGVGEG